MSKKILINTLLTAIMMGFFISFASAETINYTYDDMDRLIQVEYDDGTIVDYVYGNLGNRLQKFISPPGAPPNNPPNPSTDPTIAPGATDVAMNPDLEWIGGGDPDAGDEVVYYLYFGLQGEPLELVYSGWDAHYAPDLLEPLTTYCWRVDQKDSHNGYTVGTVWCFTTEEYTGDFEHGLSHWTVDNGLWEVGEPTAGPSTAHAGTGCAGTILDGNYPSETDSRLISPAIQLPTVTGEEEVHLRFWQWFSYYYYGHDDYGLVQVQVKDEVTGDWSTWATVSNNIYDSSGAWSRMVVDLTGYSGQTVRVAFYHIADDDIFYGSGWYIDDVEIWHGVPVFNNPEGFESDWGNWNADNGLWEIGEPTTGPGSAHGGSGQCAGTVLSGDYTRETDSRLISPAIQLPTVTGEEEVHLRFWQWFSYYTDHQDYGLVQLSTHDEVTGDWSVWTAVSDNIYDSSGGWLFMDINFTAYAGQTVRVGFFHNADDDISYGSGWYIDDVEIWHSSNDTDNDDDGIPNNVEDADQDGIVDEGETDPNNADSDNDGIQDGTELGYTLADIGPDTDIDIFQPDLDPLTTTNPLEMDTDGDGFNDGVEDSNQNGRVDAGESDPLDNNSLPTTENPWLLFLPAIIGRP